MKNFFVARKKSGGKIKTVLSLYQEEFSWRQKKIVRVNQEMKSERDRWFHLKIYEENDVKKC